MGFGDRRSRGTIVDYGSPEAMEADLAAAEASTAGVGTALDAEEAEGTLPSKSLDEQLFQRFRKLQQETEAANAQAYAVVYRSGTRRIS